MATYETRQEAIDAELMTPLGEFADQHDTEAIADEVLGTDDDGKYHVKVTQNAFWAIVAKHAA